MQKALKKDRNWKGTATWIFVLMIFMAELLFYTWCRVQCIELGYEITRSNIMRRNHITLQSNLKIELARLKSPDRIARIAVQKLGLIVPGPDKVLIMP